MSQITCPYCGEQFEVTWWRYLELPSGKYTCDKCDKESNFVFSPKLFKHLAMVIWMFPFFSPLIFAHKYGYMSYFSLLFIIPMVFLHKKFYTKFGTLIQKATNAHGVLEDRVVPELQSRDGNGVIINSTKIKRYIFLNYLLAAYTFVLAIKVLVDVVKSFGSIKLATAGFAIFAIISIIVIGISVLKASQWAYDTLVWAFAIGIVGGLIRFSNLDVAGYVLLATNVSGLLLSMFFKKNIHLLNAGGEGVS